MARILLVNSNKVTEPYPVPPLGLCLVASSLSARGHEVAVFDALGSSPERLRAKIAEFQPGYIAVGIRNIDDCVMGGADFLDSLLNDTIIPIKETASVPLILGGSGFSIFPEELLAFTGADYGIVGEGEEALPRLIESLQSGETSPAIPGLYRREGGAPTEKISTGLDLSRIPDPRLSRWLDFSVYAGRGAYSVQTKRGCGHTCIYCSYPAIEGRRFRVRDPSAVVDEIERVVYDFPGATVEFVDSTFNDPPGHAEAICAEIIRRGVKVRLRTMGMNPAGVTPELLRAMAKAGFAQIDTTPDTASASMLAAMGKNFTLEELQRSAMLIREFEMPTMWFFLLGGPGESRETLLETFDFIDSYVHPDDLAHISGGLRVYPHSALYRIGLKAGVFRQGQPLLRPVHFVEPTLGAEGLNAILKEEISKRVNCVHSSESKPGPEVMGEAMRMRRELSLDEPMFRTLLRIKKRNGERRRLML